MFKPNLLKSYCIAIALSALPFLIQAQAPAKLKPNWQNLDLPADSTFGISTEKAYTELLKGKKSIPVLVAVIDGGVDINHEDLKSVIWTNPHEKAGNNKDDDKNGYIDDIHGWDFIGGPKGDIHFENLEATRIVRQLKPKYENVTASTVSAADKAEYEVYTRAKADYDEQLTSAQKSLQLYTGIKGALDSIVAAMPKDAAPLAFFESYTPTSTMQTRVKTVVVRNLKIDPDFEKFRKAAIDAGYTHFYEVVNYHLNLSFAPRDIVGDNISDPTQHFYGNADVDGPDADHGTHVSGIIGAIRDNNIGVKGVADNVRIMSVRTVPNGDERDKDVANAIRYAAANGARVINMSFGKGYSPDKKEVDDAVKFAISKDVLIVHAAGNDNKNLDAADVFNYPNRTYADHSGSASNWIEVGASGPKDDESLKASFSNYGKTSVDVFAPGVLINSTIPDSKYAEFSGTSMASPVVAGLAALIRSYYPKLSAAQVKEAILRSVVPVNHDIAIRDGQNMKKVPFSDLCVTGGVVNTYNALKIAATM